MFWRKKQAMPQDKKKPSEAESAPKAVGPARSKGTLLSLESRLMFDAAAAATAAEVNQEQVAQEQAESAVSNENTSGSESQASVESQELLQAIASYSPGNTPTEIAFVDPTVPDYQTLIAGMGPNVQVVMLDGGQDGMEQIAASLTGRTGIDAIHLISHGDAGTLLLGTGTLNVDTMTGQYADELATIQQSLSEQADILVYGCDFAEGETGQVAVNLLAEMTGADVQASSDETGHVSLGGDWEFEVQTGTIETSLAVGYDAQVNWAGLLGTETVSDTFSAESYSNNNGTQSWSTSWSETDASGGGASGGDVRVNSSQLRIDTDTVGNAISRGVNLSGATSATLTFDYTNALLGADRIEVRVSTDGGTNYQALTGGIFSSAANTGSGTASLDLSSYMSANTKIQFIVTATGGGERLYVDNVQVSYQTNNAPAITSNGGGATASISVAENTTTVTTVAATDADAGQTLTYSISGGADAAMFTINSSTGALSFTTPPNYEAPTDSGGNNVYDVTVQVSDGNGGMDTQTLAVTVTNEAITSVSATGSATALGGGVYTLNLGANENATSWTINWGDGTIETVAGNPGSVTHTYAAGNAGLTFNILASATDAAGTHFVNDVIAPTAFLTGEGLYRYDADSGTFEQYFSGAEVTNPYAVTVGPDGLIYVAGHTSDNIVRYNATTGAFVDTFVAAGSGGLNAAAGLAFGPDGHLYVSNQIGDSILKYDGTTGAFISTFVSAGSGGLNAPVALIFRPDGYLYVGSYNSDSILRYNPTTGAFVDTFVAAGSGGLNGPAAMAWGPDGNLYVASNDATVKRYNGTTGAYIDNFVTTGSGGLGEAVGLAFGPDGNLYVSSYSSDKIIKYNGTTGALIGDYVTAGSGGLDGPTSFTFLPNQQVKVVSTNASPTLDASKSPALTTQNEDAGAPVGAVGTLVSSLVDFASPAGQVDNVTDSDSGALLGIAITAADTTNGSWFYSTDNGTNWNALGSVTNTSARLLAADSNTRIYFQSNADYHGSVPSALTFRAWDRTTGNNSGTTDTSTNGGTTAFSAATDTASLTVTPVNDVPTITNLSGDSLSYSEGDGAVVIEQGDNVLVADVDSTNLDTGTLTVSIPSGGDSAEDVLGIRNQGTGAGQIGVSGANITYEGVTIGTFTGGSGGSNLVITLNSSATPTAVTALVKNITYQNTDTNAPTTGARTVRYVLTDGDGGTSTNYDTTVTVTAVNDAPLNTVPGAQSTNEETALVFSSGNGNQISIQDPDGSGSTCEVTVSVTNGTLTLASTTGLIFTTGDGTTDSAMTFRGTVANINTALNGLSYNPTADYNGSATLTITSVDNTLVSLNVDANLQAHYTFDGTANDVAPGMAQNGTLTNGASIVTDNTRGQVLNLDGVNDFIDLSSSTADFASFTEGTISGWIKATGTYETIFSISDTADTGSYAALFLGASGYLTYEVMENGVMQLAVYKSDITINDGNWHHVAVSIGPSGNVLYVDGVAATAGQLTYDAGNTSTQGFFSSVSSLDSMAIGRNQDSTGGKWYATGRLDDVRVYDRVLSGAEVSSLANDLNLTDMDTVAITVNAVNDAPVLVDTALSITVAEDAAAPSGAVGSLLSAFTGGITDVDSGASKGIAITGTNETNGTWYYTTNGGSTWTAVGTVSNTSALLLADNGNTRLYFASNADYNGTSSGALTLRAWDQTSGSAGSKVTTASNGGTTAFSSATDSIDVTVTAVNDTPTDLSLSASNVAENAGNGTVVGTITGTDPDTGDTKTYSLTDSAGGRFAIDGSTGQITVADGSLLDYESATSHNVTVRVTDSGGLTYDETFTITVTNVNEAPTGADATITISEDTSHTLTTADFGFSDVDAGDSLSAVRIDTVPSVGSLTLSGVAVTAGQVVSVADLTAGNLVFTSAVDANGTGYANFTFSVRDSNNAYDAAPNTLTVDVTTVNDAPIRTAGTVSNLTVSEDAGLVSLGLGSVTYSPGGGADESGQTLTYAVTALPSGTIGNVYLADGTTLVTLSAYTLAEIQGMQFQPTANASGVTAFQFNVYDSGGTANGGANTISQFILITVNAVNDASTITNLSGDSLSYSEGDGPVVIEQSGNAVVADVDSTNLDTGTLTVSIPAGGDATEDVLSIRNQGTGAGQIGVSSNTITYQGVTIGTFTGGSGGSDLVITFNASATPTVVTALVQNITYENTDTSVPSTGARTVRYVLTDGDGGTSANYDTTVTVTAVNDAPVLTPVAPDVTFVEGGMAQVIDATGTITDVDSANFDGGVLTVSISANGTADDRVIVGNWGTGPGQVGVSGSDVTYGGTVIGTASGGTSGSDPLVITFNTSATPTAVQEVYRSIQFNNVSENPSTATRTLTIGLTDGDGGTAIPQTKLVYVQGTNDVPVLTFGEGDKNFTEGMLAVMIDALPNVSDLDSTDFDTGTLTITISANPSVDDRVELLNTGMGAGQIGVSGTNVYYGGTLVGTQAGGIGSVPFVVTFNANADADIVGEVMANIRFWVAGDSPSTATRTVEAVLTDGDGGTSLTASKQITVTAVNDPTVVTGGTSGSGTEDTIITNTLTATDVEGLSDGTVFTVSANATNGVASIDPATGLWSYTPNADWNGSDSFTVTITDDAGNTATQVISVTVTPVNDAPLLVANTGSTVAEGGTDTISSSELAVTDIEQAAAQLSYSIGAGPLYGRLELTTAPGILAATFTQDDIAANRLIYIHDGSETTSDSFTFTMNDGAGGSLGPTTVTLTITPVNDTPTISSDGGGAIASLNVAENVSAVTIVTGADVDLPTQALSYSISGGVDQALFTINTTTGDLSFTAPPDFEVATDANGDNVYVVQVQVVDSQGASTTQTIQVTVTDVVESVAPPPVVPPILLTPIPPPSSGGPTSGPGAPPADEPATASDPTTVPPGPTVPPMVGPPVNVVPLTLVPPSDRPVERVPEEPRKTEEDAKDRPLFLVNDDQGHPLYSVLPVEPAPTLEPEPPETTPSVSDLLMAKLDEMAVSLEQAVSQSQERHELMARVAAVTGTTLSVGFVAWALRSGAILASMLATMPAWQHFDPLPVVKLTRNERKHRRDEATRAQQQEAAEFKGLNQVLDKAPTLKRTA